MAISPVRSRLQPYLPRLTLEWLADDPERRHREVDGSVVFVDISGFTALSEKLARLGREGAEEMAASIDACFGELLAVAYEGDGSLLKFGGDALLLLFSGGEPVDHAARAARAAVAMRARLRTAGKLATAGGKVTLRMSVGVHTGRFDVFLVGESHREMIVTGPAATRVVTMEGTATAGQIVVSPETAALLPARCVGDRREGRAAPRGARRRVGVHGLGPARGRRRAPRALHPARHPGDGPGGDRRARAPAGVGGLPPLRRYRRGARARRRRPGHGRARPAGGRRAVRRGRAGRLLPGDPTSMPTAAS